MLGEISMDIYVEEAEGIAVETYVLDE